MTRDEQILSLRHCVEYHAHRLARAVPGMYQDYCSEGWIGAIQATDAFEPGHGATLQSYAERRIRGAMIDSIRRQSEDKRIRVNGQSMAHHIAVVPLDELQMNYVGSGDGDMRATAMHISLGWILAGAKLSLLQERVIGILFGPSEPSIRQAGRALGKSGAYIYQLKHAALAKLRAAS